jgi:predicted nucleic acid-binding protein
MGSELEFIYWDSCVFSSYIGGIPERMSIIDELLQRIKRNRRVKILTSTYSIAEVVFASGHGQGKFISTDHYTLIDKMWQSSFLELIDVHQMIMYKARDLVRYARLDQNNRLNIGDAIHLATAAWANQSIGMVKAFHTYDNLSHFSPLIDNIPIEEPTVEQPKFPFA